MESIRISDEIVVTVLEIRGQRVQLGIEAPPDVPVLRRELCQPPVATAVAALSPPHSAAT
jgi:carbon storage regulator